MTSHSSSTPTAAAPARAVRHFGRFQLLQLLGKSERSMAWRVMDPRSDQELVIVMPRRQPVGDEELERWQTRMRRGARLKHPNLVALLETGVQDRWPFAVYDAIDHSSLAELIVEGGMPGEEAADWAVGVAEGMAFAHDAGHAHGDLQPYLVLVGPQGTARVLGLGVALDPLDRDGKPAGKLSAIDAPSLTEQREAAQRDVLALGLMLHWALAGQPPVEEPDLGRVIERLPPQGREIVRLPWTTAQPIAEPLRVICNRATDRQERQRYRNARTFARALDGWRQAADSGGGPLALLLDRLRSVGLLPATPGGAARVARMAMMERERTSELADIVLQDPALSLELLRVVNTAQVRGGQVAGTGPVLTVRRAILMVGMDGVRRAALGLRDWPGALPDNHVPALERMLERVKLACRVAQRLRPAGYDAEVCWLVTLMQNLGLLVVQYHFPDEMAQITRLMQPVAASREGEPDEPGMSEEGASFAVLGIDIEAMGLAVARHWGLDNAVLGMIRRQPVEAPVRSAESDDELLRLLGSCASEAVDASRQPASKVKAALQRVLQRYARVLGIQIEDLHLALDIRLAPAHERAGAADTTPGEHA